MPCALELPHDVDQFMLRIITGHTPAVVGHRLRRVRRKISAPPPAHLWRARARAHRAQQRRREQRRARTTPVPKETDIRARRAPCFDWNQSPRLPRGRSRAAP